METSYELASVTDISSLNENNKKDPRLELPKSKEKLIAQFEKYYNDCRTRRYPFERQWYTNLAFYSGKQWVQWQGGAVNELSRLVEPAAPRWRVRMVINKIKPIIRGELAKIIQEEPSFYVIPKTTEEEDILAARAGENVGEHLYRTLELSKEKRKAAWWALLTGNGFIKDWYDEEEVDKDGIKGKIHAESVTPFHLFIPVLEEEEIERQPYIIQSMAKDPEWIKERFGIDLKPDSKAGTGPVEQKFVQALGIKSGNAPMVSVKEIWIKPNKEFPDGAVCMWAGNEILHFQSVWPYEHGEYPFSRINHIPTGRFYADSVIVDLIPLQRELNRTRSQIIESKNRMSKPQLIAPRGSLDASQITTEPGLVIFYQPGYAPPQPLPMQGIPSYVLQEVDRIQMDMDDISAQHEVSKGKAPPGVEAATAISFLQEQDDNKLAPTVSSLEECLEKTGRHLLSHVVQFWKAERVINITGTNSVWEARKLTGKDLRGNFNYKVEKGSATPTSRAAKRAFFTELADKGHITSDKMLNYLDLGETRKMYEDSQRDSRHAQRENIKMAEMGMPVEVNNWDNHLAHIFMHDNYRKTQEYEILPEEIQAAFEQHSRMHHEALSAEVDIPVGPTGRLPYEVLLQLGQGGIAPAGPQS